MVHVLSPTVQWSYIKSKKILLSNSVFLRMTLTRIWLSWKNICMVTVGWWFGFHLAQISTWKQNTLWQSYCKGLLSSFSCVIYSPLSPYNDVSEYIYIYIYIYIIYIYIIYIYFNLICHFICKFQQI